MRAPPGFGIEIALFYDIARKYPFIREIIMPRGDKSAYSDKQKRKAEHIEEGYENRGVSAGEAKRRAWATVNKESGGGKKSGSGRGKPENHESSHKGGKKGGAASAHRTAAQRSASAKKAAATRKRNAAAKSH
jgi:plasmid stabilization system protein ParE